jgi:hypothetical protein
VLNGESLAVSVAFWSNGRLVVNVFLTCVRCALQRRSIDMVALLRLLRLWSSSPPSLFLESGLLLQPHLLILLQFLSPFQVIAIFPLLILALSHPRAPQPDGPPSQANHVEEAASEEDVEKHVIVGDLPREADNAARHG